MRLIGCDRCGATFPISTKRTEVQLTEFTGDCDQVGEPTWKELCPVCRRDLNEWFDGTNGVPERVGPRTMPGRETGPQPTPAPHPDAQDLDESAAPPDAAPGLGDILAGVGTEPDQRPRAQDSEQNRHTCELCGREGTRRYVETETGWRCSPSAKCTGNQKPAPAAAEREPAPVQAAELPAGITAKCQDCSRSWTLTGRVLTQAVEMHEQKHSHVVDVADGAA